MHVEVLRPKRQRAQFIISKIRNKYRDACRVSEPNAQARASADTWEVAAVDVRLGKLAGMNDNLTHAWQCLYELLSISAICLAVNSAGEEFQKTLQGGRSWQGIVLK